MLRVAMETGEYSQPPAVGGVTNTGSHEVPCRSVRDSAPTAKSLFWVITQRVVAIYYRCFGATYRVPSSGVENPIKTVFFRQQAFAFAFAFTMLSCCGTACSELLLM